MVKIIEALLWVFTNKIKRAYWINLTTGFPGESDAKLLQSQLKEKYGEDFLLTFDENTEPFVKHFYFKKK